MRHRADFCASVTAVIIAALSLTPAHVPNLQAQAASFNYAEAVAESAVLL
jgi:hypothetical protein